MTELDDFRTNMLARQAEAEEAMVHGDAEPRMALWSSRDPRDNPPREQRPPTERDE